MLQKYCIKLHLYNPQNYVKRLLGKLAQLEVTGKLAGLTEKAVT